MANFSKLSQPPNQKFMQNISFIGLAEQGKDINSIKIHYRVYNSLRDFFRPLGNNNNHRSIFYMRIFEK
jgi:hypothetical protein